MHMELPVFRAALSADGLRDSQLEKSALKMVTIRVVQFRLGTSKLLFVKKLIEQNPHEMCERCAVSIGTAAKNVRDDLNQKKKIVARLIPHLLPDQQKKQRVDRLFKGLAQNV